MSEIFALMSVITAIKTLLSVLQKREKMKEIPIILVTDTLKGH